MRAGLECALGIDQEVTEDDREIVPALRAALAQRVGSERCEMWFGAATRLALADGRLLVSVPNRFYQDWLRANFRRDLEAAAREVCGADVVVEFELDPALESLEARPLPAAVAGPAADPPPRSPRRRFASLDALVVCDGNRLAWTSARLAADQPGRHSPLFLCGPTGVGKTHLLEGIWSAYKRAAHGRPALYLTAEQFTCLFLEALRQSGLPSFRRKVRDVGLLLIDDVQFFAGKRATLSELLHTVDTLTREGQQLVLAADRPPSALKALGPELLSRLSGSVQCQLTPPDYAARLEIVARLTVAWELSLPDDVQALVASHFAAHVRQLQGALRRLQAARLAHQRPITLETAEDCLSELLLEQQRAVQLADIERVVVETFGLEPQSLQSDAKHKYVSHPRMLAMWLARKHTRAALSEIGRYFGKRSHTTVISARRKIESLMTQGAQIDLADRRWKVEDAIRRVEDRLRAS